ncbi:MAG TPA: glycoside hydrolase family 18 protein [Rhabdochlamydiaceae bacterium]|jgi:GH18 family chitinase|nr:glycoside hydrolase family 18 protein [Rhabdochlamydiaceae bacterium]
MFETGAYYHKLKGIDTHGIQHVTFLESDEMTSEALKTFQKDHPKIKVSLAFEKKGYGRTVRAHQGMDIVKECSFNGEIRIALPASLPLLKSFDLKSLAALDVKIDLMAFDFVRPEPGCRTNFHSVLFSWEGPSVIESLQYLYAQGIDSHRIILGLTTFGILFKNVAPGMSNTGYGQLAEGPQLEKAEIRAQDIVNYREKNPSAKLFYTSLKGCFQSFLYNPQTGDWIAFDDELTRRSKKEWARRQKLGGVFFYL